jgi:hypothetical protein
MTLEPCAFAGPGQSDGEHYRALRFPGLVGRWWTRCSGGNCCGLGYVGRVLSFARFSGGTSRARQGWCLCGLRWTATPATPSATAIAVAAQRLCTLLARTHHAGWLRFVRCGLGFSVSFRLLGCEIALPVGIRLTGCGLGELRLERGWVLLPGLFVLRFAPLTAVAHPSAHVALVTRLPSR